MKPSPSERMDYYCGLLVGVLTEGTSPYRAAALAKEHCDIDSKDFAEDLHTLMIGGPAALEDCAGFQRLRQVAEGDQDKKDAP